jgi:hypothetical protein
MHEIAEGLWVGSLETARTTPLIRLKGIKCIISLGCSLNDLRIHQADKHRDDLAVLAFPEIRDAPDAYIIDIAYVCCQIIACNLRDDAMRPTLVHCVYGQSRSVAIVCFYLISLSFTRDQPSLLGFEDIIQYVRSKHPDICINPGFLCQLYLIYCRKTFHIPEFELLHFGKSLPTFQFIESESIGMLDVSSMLQQRVVDERISHRRIICSRCKAELAKEPNDVILEDLCYTTMIEKLVDEHWKDYPSLNPKRYTSPSEKSMVVLSPSAAVCEGFDWDYKLTEGTVVCRGCGQDVGIWKKDGLSMFGNYLPAFLLALNKSCIQYRRLAIR